MDVTPLTAGLSGGGGVALPTAAEAVAVLLAALLGQLSHELSHFAAARALGVQAIIRFRVRTLMSVNYSRDWLDLFWHTLNRGMHPYLRGKTTKPVTPRMKLLINLAPVYTGVGGAVLYLALFGWPAPSWGLVAAGLAWTWHTLPSREDREGLGEALGFGELAEWQRSAWKGLLALAVGSWVPVLPYHTGYLTLFLSYPMLVAATAMLLLAVHQAHTDGAASVGQ